MSPEGLHPRSRREMSIQGLVKEALADSPSMGGKSTISAHYGERYDVFTGLVAGIVTNLLRPSGDRRNMDSARAKARVNGLEQRDLSFAQIKARELARDLKRQREERRSGF